MTPENRPDFYKMTGSGNDFVFLDGRFHAAGDWGPERIQGVCHRNHGVGADGVVILEPAGEGVLRFNYFNADGSRGEMCGNASLCAVTLASRIGLARGPVTLRTDSGDVTGLIGDSPDQAAVTLTAAADVREVPEISLETGETAIWRAKAGVPHVVVSVADVSRVDLATRGRALRHDPVFQPAGTNANFVAQTPDGSWAYRTFERGVEGETLACGTGAVCVAAVLVESGRATYPVRIRTRSGKPLVVDTSGDGAVVLTGEGRLVFAGMFDLL